MISVVFYRRNGVLNGFKLQGHAGYAKRGKDIVCAAVSSLVISTINALEKYTDDEKRILVTEDKAVMAVRFKKAPGHDASLLMRSMADGLAKISAEYGFVDIIVKEEKNS